MIQSTPIQYSVFQEKDNPLFGEGCSYISIDDEGGGAFLVIEQFPDEGKQTIKVDLKELEQLYIDGTKLITRYRAKEI